MPPVKTVKNDTDVVVPKAGETYVSEDGTVSQVLDDHIDASYEPTEEEVLEFADWIGMKLPEDSEYLWLAREGLKTPLPKEWKPCSTNDGEVYYFNFKTGESSWDHPMDSMFRQRFEQEKAKTRKGGKAVSTANAAASASSTAAAAAGGRAPLSTPGKAVIIPQTRVIMTESGISRRDTGPAVTAPITSSTGVGTTAGHTNTHAAGEKTRKSDKAATTTSAAAAAAAPPPPASTTATTGFNHGSSLATGGVGTRLAAQPIAAPAAAAAPRRIVSEAERAMEERVQRDVQRAFETEKARLADAHAGTMASLQQLHETDVAEIRASDEKRRAVSTQQEDEERERRLQQTREKCEELYGDELRAMEREEETLSSRLQKMEAEAGRAASGNTQRTQVEEQMRATLARQRAELEASMKTQHDAALAAENAAHTAAMQKTAREAQEKVSALQQASQRKMDAAERTMALEVDGQKKDLEQKLKETERRIAEVSAAVTKAVPTTASTSSVPTAGTTASLSDELARISAAKAAQLCEVENEGKKEREAAQARGEAALNEVTKQLQPSLSPTAVLGTPTSRAPSFSGDRPVSAVVLGGGFSGSRTTSATLSVAFTQELNRVRMARAKERQERLAQLKVERDAALAAASVSPSRSLAASGRAASSTRSDADASGPASLEELKAAHAEELEAKKVLYARLEEELKAQLAREASAAAAATTAEQQSVVVAKAVDAEMELYTQEVLARHARMKLEADAKREKQLSDHKLAMEAYERKKAEVEARQVREAQEAQEAFIQEKVDAAVAAETAKLEAAHATAMTRLAARYAEERGAAKGEVDEEMEAYERAEREKIVAAAAAAVASASLVAPPQLQRTPLPGASQDSVAAAPAGTAAEARCAQVSRQLAEQTARAEAAQAAAEARREALTNQRNTLASQQQHHQQHLTVLNGENARLAASLAAAEAQRDAARRTASSATPPAASPAAALAVASSDAPPSGYRMRALHEAGMRALEDGYRTEHAALEADLQVWRTKVQQLLLEQQQQQRRPTLPAPASTALNTPRQQVLSHPSSAATSAAAGSAHRTPVLLTHASPIAPTAAGASLQNTPTPFYSFGDSPWLQRSTSPPTATAAAAPPFPSTNSGLSLYGGATTTAPHLGPASAERLWTAPSTRDAVQYSREHQQNLQQRHLALMAAREAWQQQRVRELQQQQQLQLRRENLHPPAAASFTHSGVYERLDFDEDRQRRHYASQRQPSPPLQDQLSLVLSKLTSRLDSLTGQAEEMQQHQRRSRSGRGDASYRVHSATAAAGSGNATSLSAREQGSHSRRQASPPLPTSPSAVRKSARSPHASRRNSSRHEESLSMKWNSLLGSRERK